MAYGVGILRASCNEPSHTLSEDDCDSSPAHHSHRHSYGQKTYASSKTDTVPFAGRFNIDLGGNWYFCQRNTHKYSGYGRSDISNSYAVNLYNKVDGCGQIGRIDHLRLSVHAHFNCVVRQKQYSGTCGVKFQRSLSPIQSHQVAMHRGLLLASFSLLYSIRCPYLTFFNFCRHAACATAVFSLLKNALCV